MSHTSVAQSTESTPQRDWLKGWEVQLAKIQKDWHAAYSKSDSKG